MTNAPIPSNAADVQAAAAAVLRMIQGLHISRAVYVAAKLGIADLLAEGPRPASELAKLTKADAPSLYRVLRRPSKFFTSGRADISRSRRSGSGCERMFLGRCATGRR
jgi:hypothetical protein